MANPLDNLEDGLQRLRDERDGLNNEIKAYTKLLETTEKDILKFEIAIILIKKGV